ncbi:MAG: hypothetical protein ACE5D6_02400 [Candidatus Zixiibacteriota bacterium]
MGVVQVHDQWTFDFGNAMLSEAISGGMGSIAGSAAGGASKLIGCTTQP